MSTLSNFGSLAGGITFGLLVLIYAGFISSDLFKEVEHSPYFSPLVSNDQARKVCKIKEKKQHGFLYNLLIGQSGGSELANGLKQLGSKLNHINQMPK